MDILKEWADFCREIKEFNVDHFYTLFHRQLNEKEIKAIFDFFPENEKLIERYNRYKTDPIGVSNETLMALVKRDINNKMEFCSTLNDQELVALLDKPKYTLVNSDEFEILRQSDIPHFLLMELIGDYMIQEFRETKPGNALLEAFYGLTTNTNLVWYLGKPLYRGIFDPDPYFNVWAHSGDYVLGENEIFIHNKVDK